MEANELLRQILAWQKIQGLAAFRLLAPILLDSKEKQTVYELSDGSLTRDEISKKAKVATGTISNWWNKWSEAGILSHDGNKYTKITTVKNLFLDKDIVKDRF